jgi:acyl-CoA dehydrogenase
MGTILRHGSEAQRQTYLPRIAGGELRLQAFAVTEPDAGSDTTAIKTRARRVDGGYVVDGQKIWTSRAEHSDLMVLLARTTPAEVPSRGSFCTTCVPREPQGAKPSSHPIAWFLLHPSGAQGTTRRIDGRGPATIGDSPTTSGRRARRDQDASGSCIRISVPP